MLALSITRLGSDKRGTPRIWLEGRNLAKAGFVPAARYEITVDQDARQIKLRLAANGGRLVSRKKRGDQDLPVIDIANNRLLEPFEGLESLKVRFENGAVIITPTATDIRKLERTQRLRDSLQAGKVSVGSVSTGLGVLALAMHEGLAAAGIHSDLKFAVEIEPQYLNQCAATNPAWRPDTVAVETPMQELAYDASALQQLPQVDILEAGIPCTAHSVAGRAKKALAKPEDDPKAGHLVAGFLAIAAAVNPAVILVENVPEYMSSASFAILTNQLREWGYHIEATVLEGKEFGCLEHRNRMAMVAVTKGIDFDIRALDAEHSKPRPLGDLLEPIPEDSPLWSPMTYLREKEQRDIAAGKGFRMQIFDATSTHVSTIGRGYAKVRSTEPKLRHPSRPNLLRQLTPIEHARIKGVPEHMIDGLGVTLAHEMLGQSILARPFKALAGHIGKVLSAWSSCSPVPEAHHARTPRTQPFALGPAATAQPVEQLPLFANA